MSRLFWNPYSESQKLKQKQKIEQRQIQLQDQNNSNRLLMLLLSSAESFTSKLNCNIKREYFSHDFGHSFESKSINRLLLQFIEQIETFESSYRRYCKTYNNQYDFPYDAEHKKGLSREEIIRDLIKWMNLVDEKYKKYYEAVINIFNNKRIPDFTDDIENIPDLNDSGKEDKCNPKELRDVYPVLLEQINSEKKQISKDYKNNKNLKIIINKEENNNNYEYEKKITEKLMKNKIYSSDPIKAKTSIKYKPIKKFNEDYINIPQFVVQKLKEIYPIDETYYQTLNNWLCYYKDDSLYHTLNEFFGFLKFVDKKQINQMIDYICDEIYKELIFDNK